MSMWEPFSESSRRVVVHAQQASQELGHNYIGTEHMLIGIARGEGTAAAAVLREMGASYSALFDRVHDPLPSQASKPREMTFTPGAKRSIEFAFEEARVRNQTVIEPEHLLLALLREGRGRPQGLAASVGLTYEAVAEKLGATVTAVAFAEKPFIEVDHVQLAMPAGEEETARAFYVDVLGMEEIEKPRDRAARGGVWFASGRVQIHLGADESFFRSTTRSHPALRCRHYSAFVEDLRRRGIAVEEVRPLGGGNPRAYLADPFGNRIELVA